MLHEEARSEKCVSDAPTFVCTILYSNQENQSRRFEDIGHYSYVPRDYQQFYSELPTINDSNDSGDDDINLTT